MQGHPPPGCVNEVQAVVEGGLQGVPPTAATLKRFLVGPKGCEITGCC
jgi:secreted PhoX family phosphatase